RCSGGTVGGAQPRARPPSLLKQTRGYPSPPRSAAEPGREGCPDSGPAAGAASGARIGQAGAFLDEVQYLVCTLLHVRSEIAQLELQRAVDLASTRTPRSTSVFPDLQTSSAPGSWESRETTRPVTPMLERARTTSATRRSPKPRGAPDRCTGESPAIA